jgi:predicted ATPase/DNA-binding CsgD family transcriptional regulator/Tfp pilus assembly protein PilF
VQRAPVALPAQPGPLIGREADVALTLERLLQADVRLLSLVGAAGAGKTRLAIEVAQQAAPASDDGVAFVDLAPITEPGLLATAIARAVGIREQRERPLLDLLKEHFAARRVLLVLDNFEQILAAGPRLADLLQACPSIKLLVTSRSALRLRWEYVVQVAPLAVPDLQSLPQPEVLAEVPAVALFVQRAQRVDPGFRLSQANARAVAEVCVRLDGLPLAIELAAARARVLPPQSLVNRLGERLDLLATTTQDQPARQRTLRVAIDASYELLSAAEQALFRRLGVFVGGCSLAAVAEVCDPQGSLGLDALATIESLIDKSLLRPERRPDDEDEPRFGMLETIREYALERLAHSGEQDAARRQHAAYYLGGADVALAQITSAHQAAWLRSLDAEHANLLAALAWCQDVREPDLGLRASGLLAWFWTVRGHLTEGRRQVTALLELAGPERTPLRAEALRVTGSLALHQGDDAAARALFEASLAIRREQQDRAGSLGALSGLGAAAMQLGDDATAEACFREALATQQALDDTLGMAESLNSLANLAHGRGDLAAARELYERSNTFNRLVGYRSDVVMHNLGVVAQEQGDLAAARRHFEDSVAIKRALGDTPGLALSLAKLGEVLASTGDLAAAHRMLSESLSLQRDLGDRPGIAFVLERFAITAAASAQPERALRLAGAADALREAIGKPLASAARDSLERSLASARRGRSAEVGAAAWSDGRATPMEQAISLALSAPGQGDRAARHEEPAFRLSPREREVAMLVAEGLSNREIAERLVVSERTAENHVQRVLNRLGLRSRARVAFWAVQHGLLKPE